MSLYIHTEGWHAWIDPDGVQFISSGFIYFLGNTSNGEMNCPFWLTLLTIVTRERLLRFEQKISDVCISIQIFSCVCAVQQWGRCRRNCKVLQDYVEWFTVHSEFLDLKIPTHRFRSETRRSWEWRSSGFLTEDSWLLCRKTFNNFLTVSSFLLQNRVPIPFLVASRLARCMTSAIGNPKLFLSIKRQCSARSYLKLRTRHLPTFDFYCFTCAFLPVFKKQRNVVCGKLKILDKF